MGFLVVAAGAAALAVGAAVETFLALGAFAKLILLNVVASKLFGPKIPDSLENLSAISVMRRSAIEYRKIVYGQASVSGPIVYNNVSGTDREYLWYVVALADGEIEDLVSVWLDGDEIPKADIAWTAGTGGADGTGTGDVSTAKWVGDNSTNAVQIYYMLGNAAQVVNSNLDTAFSDWTTNHRLRGISYMVVKLLYNVDTEEVWSAGAPQNLKAVIKGRKIYDPRLDSTQIIDSTTSPFTYGSGAHRAATESTWAWSENPALCVADYLMNFMGVSATSGINWETIASAADDCEVSVAIPSTTEDRFTCNGTISMGASHKDNLDSLLSSCDGKLSYSEGEWRLRVSVWEASSVSFDEDDLAGPVEVRGSAPKSERFNTVRGVFVDPDRKYQATEFPIVTNSNYITRDAGRIIERDLELPMTNTATMAQRIGIRLLEQSDNQIIARIKTNARGAKAAIGDVVSLTVSKFSWSAKTFRVIEWQRNPDATFDLTLREDASASYTDPLTGDYVDGNTGNVTVPPDVCPPPSGLAATAVSGGVELTWTSPPAAEHNYIDIFEDTDSGWAGATHVARVRADNFFVPHTTATPQYYWVRSVRNPDLVSIRDPDSDTTTITATPIIPSDGSSGSAAIFVNQYIRQASTPSTPGASSASYNFDTTTFTPTSGWSAGVPAADGNPVWVSTAQFYSADSTGTDSSTTWSAPQKLAEDGDAGTDGSAAVYVNQYQRASSPPGTPGSTSASYNFDTQTFTPTSGWSAGVPADDGNPVYVSTAQFYSADGTGTDSSTTWSATQKSSEDGAAGADGVLHYLTNEAHVVVANYGGTGYTLINAGGDHKVFDGTTDVTSSATHEIVGGTDNGSNWTKAQNGLTLQVIEATGVYTLSGSSWVSDEETFTLRATYDTVDYDKVYTIAKALQGNDGGCAVDTLTSISLDDTGIGGTRTVGFRVHSDGTIDTRANNASGYVNKETWIGACANTSYECNFVSSGSALTTGTPNDWRPCSTTQTYELSRSTNGISSRSGTIQIRRTSDDTVVGTANVSLRVERSL